MQVTDRKPEPKAWQKYLYFAEPIMALGTEAKVKAHLNILGVNTEQKMKIATSRRNVMGWHITPATAERLRKDARTLKLDVRIWLQPLGQAWQELKDHRKQRRMANS